MPRSRISSSKMNLNLLELPQIALHCSLQMDTVVGSRRPPVFSENNPSIFRLKWVKCVIGDTW